MTMKKREEERDVETQDKVYDIEVWKSIVGDAFPV